MAGDVRPRILIVEDDRMLIKVLKSMLEYAGYDVNAVENGSEGLEQVEEAPPELVILDLGLPDISGYKVCQHIRRRFQSWDLPVLILTGRERPSDQLRGFAHGADAYLTKPCDPPELLKTVALLLGGKPHDNGSAPE